ncbi:multiple cyclophane-containing RiPP AmcA [Micromonospora sp. NBC_00898]|uniref:multiple cyclophane-containing RiPP AmcA n=1 Tax=Micromonospora sp. NBC_00898 TaxID=2975981 RepID=UPI003869FBD5
MTVYLSRNAMADQSRRRPEPGRASSQWQVRPADPPLLTHVWRRLFEQQAREGGRR